eukprot:scaffold227838_cov39-Tisochrysis_lutea.AAC.2
MACDAGQGAISACHRPLEDDSTSAQAWTAEAYPQAFERVLHSQNILVKLGSKSLHVLGKRVCAS